MKIFQTWCLGCLLKCLVSCGCRDKVLGTLAFFPPKHKTYYYEEIEQNEASLLKEMHMIIVQSHKKYTPLQIAEVNTQYYYLETDNGYSIPGIFYQNVKKRAKLFISYWNILKNQTSNDYIILYSHGNSSNLATMHEYMLDMCYTLSIDVFCYEYSGYGISPGKPSDKTLINDIKGAYKFILEKLGKKWHNIILYGQSLGTGPSTFLAAQQKYPVSGLILHSPIASGSRFVDINIQKTPFWDFFPNVEIIKLVNCPVFILHGLSDEVVDCQQGKLVWKNSKQKYPAWWVEEGNHNDIDIKFRKNYYYKLYEFIKHIHELIQNKTEKDAYNTMKADSWDQAIHISHTYRKYFVESEDKIKNFNTLNMNSFQTREYLLGEITTTKDPILQDSKKYKDKDVNGIRLFIQDDTQKEIELQIHKSSEFNNEN